MTFALWTLLAAAILPYLCTALAKSPGGAYDNATPRAWAEQLSGWRARADWAQRNHFEAFPTFAAAVLTAQWLHAPQTRIDLLAGTFLAARVAYTAAYLANQPTIRTAAWGIGFICTVLLFCSTLW